MDGIQAEITTAVNAFSENEFEKMLAETEQVLDRAGNFTQLWFWWQSYVGDFKMVTIQRC